MKHTVAFLLAALGMQVCMAQQAQVFVGKIVTLDKDNRIVEAVGVNDKGIIVALGTKGNVMREMRGFKPNVTHLAKGQALLPGFIDPHMHIASLAVEASGLAGLLYPCLPQPYASGAGKDCRYTIKESLDDFALKFAKAGSTAPMLGLELDPSRQPYDALQTAAAFKANPAMFIDQSITTGQAVVIVDQSGHFGYANLEAFTALKDASNAGEWPPKLANGARWAMYPGKTDATDPASYTGLLIEPDSYVPFMAALFRSLTPPAGKSLPKSLSKPLADGIVNAMADLRAAGVTMVTSMVASPQEYKVARLMAENCSSGTRVAMIVPPDVATASGDESLHLNGKPEVPDCTTAPLDKSCIYPKYLGVTGIKTILDGSTQGCTAALQKPDQYTPHGGCYTEGDKSSDTPDNGHGNGTINVTGADLFKQLQGLWNNGGWRFESHANGNRAIQEALETYGQLRSQSENDNRVVLIHASVGDRKWWEYAGREISGKQLKYTAAVPKHEGDAVKLKLAFTHLIGHVPYWGGLFEQVLGAETAQNIDPLAWDKEFGIPYSLHSDAAITPSMPLWFVRQAVTRETWTYPNLEQNNAHILGPQHRVSIYDALRAVTFNAAEEKGLGKLIGSIEKNKVGDFVLLSDNPLDYHGCAGKAKGNCKSPTQISDIKILATYLGGQENKGVAACTANK